VSQAPSQIRYRPREATTHIIVHDTHTSPYQSGIEHFLARKGRRMGLLEIGYHYLIRPDGTPLAIRPHTTVGTHCPGYNRVSIGVAMVGGMDYSPGGATHHEESMLIPTDTFTEDQKDGLVALCRYLMEDMGYGQDVAVVAHTELPRYAMKRHACPMMDMQDIRNRLGGTQWGT